MPADASRGLRLSWIAFGWFVAAVVTGLLVFALIALRLLGPAPDSGNAWIAAAFAIGFFAGGYFAAYRRAEPPLLYGAGMAAFSLVVWLLVNLLFSTSAGGWQALPLGASVLMLVLQAGAAALGAWVGARRVASGATAPGER